MRYQTGLGQDFLQDASINYEFLQHLKYIDIHITCIWSSVTCPFEGTSYIVPKPVLLHISCIHLDPAFNRSNYETVRLFSLLLLLTFICLYNIFTIFLEYALLSRTMPSIL